MLAFIIDYWIITLPTLLTGLILFRKLKQAREQAQKALIPAAIARQKQGK
jgi:hypothetical protein